MLMLVKQKNSYVLDEWQDNAVNRRRLKEWDLEEYQGETELAYNGCLYVKGYAPAKPEPTVAEQVAKLEAETGLTRIMREMVLAENSGASDYVKTKAQEIEDLAKELRN